MTRDLGFRSVSHGAERLVLMEGQISGVREKIFYAEIGISLCKGHQCSGVACTNRCWHLERHDGVPDSVEYRQSYNRQDAGTSMKKEREIHSAKWRQDYSDAVR